MADSRSEEQNTEFFSVLEDPAQLSKADEPVQNVVKRRFVTNNEALFFGDTGEAVSPIPKVASPAWSPSTNETKSFGLPDTPEVNASLTAEGDGSEKEDEDEEYLDYDDMASESITEATSETTTKVILDEGLIVPPVEEEENQDRTFNSVEAVAGDSFVGTSEPQGPVPEFERPLRETLERPNIAVPQPEIQPRELAIPEGFGDMFIFMVLVYFCIRWISESEYSHELL